MNVNEFSCYGLINEKSHKSLILLESIKGVREMVDILYLKK